MIDFFLTITIQAIKSTTNPLIIGKLIILLADYCLTNVRL